jgi:putative transposase
VGKQVKGRKRHILVDTMGNLLTVVVHSAGIQDRDGARAVFERAEEQGRMVRVGKVFADIC